LYSIHAGGSTIRGADVAVDAFNNPKGHEYDLAADGAYDGYRIVIGQFCTDSIFDKVHMQKPIAALIQKGFTVRMTTSEDDFSKWLTVDEADGAWIISHHSPPSEKVVEAAARFHQQGRGLFLFADNDPYTTHVNVILKKIFSNSKVNQGQYK
jgi:hypothetical protein